MELEKLGLSIKEASRVLDISTTLGYEMARDGRLPTVRFGRRLVVPRRALERLLDQSCDHLERGKATV